MKIRKMLLFSKAISVSYSFSVLIENHPCNRTKEKTYKTYNSEHCTVQVSIIFEALKFLLNYLFLLS